MSAEQNKSIVRRWVENGWNEQNVALIDELFTPDFVQHEPGAPLPVSNIEELKLFVNAYLTALPDTHFVIDDLFAEGDKVVWRFTVTGTHNGALFGIPATGTRAQVTGIIIFRLVGSKMAEAWLNLDTLGMLQQIGVIPVNA
ncbi:MAG: ester cyclase [Anaerolineae bacterium]